MSARSAARDRLAAWTAALERYGYRADPRWLESAAFMLSEVLRPEFYGAPAITLEIHELWVDGVDPAGRSVHRALHGAYLAVGSAHAQILPGDAGADRIDIGDPSKPGELIIHRHPFGQPNEYRVALGAMPVPERWLHEIEEIAAELAGE